MTRIQSLSAFLCLGLAGCSSVTAGRAALTQKPRTVVSAGDTPVALRDGDSRETINTNLDEPETPSRPDSRISGRVVDERNRAVAGVEVRLADGGARSGRDQVVTTDAAGGFTLRNLRPGGSYTLLADDGEGQGGRVEGAAPGTRVTVRLGEESRTEAADAGDLDPPKRRMNRVSEREQVDDEPEPGVASEAPARSRAARRVNADDLPPAEEAELINPAPASKVAWRKGGTDDPAVAPVDTSTTHAPRTIIVPPPKVESEPAPKVDPEPLPPPAKPLEEEGPNPFPPPRNAPIRSIIRNPLS